MNNPAYDSGYLNSAKLSGRYLFKLIARNCSDCFGIIYKYMKSDYRRYMDMGNPLYLCKTPKQIMGNMGITVDLNADTRIHTNVKHVLIYIGDGKVVHAPRTGKDVEIKDVPNKSSVIVDIVKPENLYKQYYPLHETSLTNAVTKIYEIYHLKDLYMHHSELLGN